MLETIIVILLVLWLIGLVTSNTFGGVLHLLLVIALVVFVNSPFDRQKSCVTYIFNLTNNQKCKFGFFKKPRYGDFPARFFGSLN